MAPQINSLNEALLVPSGRGEQGCQREEVVVECEGQAVPGNKGDSVALQAAGLFAFTVNYIFGAGVLGIPYAIAQGGIVCSSILLVFSSYICLMSMMWVVECQERANHILGTTGAVEFSKMCEMFISSKAQKVYDVALTVFVLCSSWMYASIVGVSFSKSVPIFSNASKCDVTAHTGPLWTMDDITCWGDYLIYLIAFSILMTFVVRMDLSGMKKLQLALTCIGLSALVLMLATVCAAIPGDGLSKIDTETKVFNASNFGAVFGTFVFAQLCSHGVPLLTQIPKRKDIIRPVFIGVISTTTLLYLLLGISCAIFFGVNPDLMDRHSVNKLITLNWQDYTMGTDNGNIFSKIAGFYVRIYPAVTCGAAFPLYAITLGNGWHYSLSSDQTLDQAETDKGMYYIAAMLPPVFAAAFMADVTFMLNFVGLSAFVIAFILPPLMQLSSRKMVPELVHTQYSWHFSKPFYCFLCLAFACVALGYTLYSIFFPPTHTSA